MSNKEVIREILNESADILASSNKAWIKGAMAMDKYGARCLPFSDKSCSFCMLGVIRKVSGEKRFDSKLVLEEMMGDRIQSSYDGYGLTMLNDRSRTTRMQVVNFLQLSALAI